MSPKLLVTLCLMFLSISTYAVQSTCPDYQQAITALIVQNGQIGGAQWHLISSTLPASLPPNGSWKQVAFLSKKSGGYIVCYATDDIYGPAIESPVQGYPCTVNGLKDNTVTSIGSHTGWAFYPPDYVMSCKE